MTTTTTEYSFIAEGAPKVKARPRLGRGRRVFTPAATLEAERMLAEQYQGPMFTDDLAIVVEYGKTYQAITISPIDYDYGGNRRGDLDNYLKLTMDALNEHAWDDDRQVKSVYAYYV